MKFIRFISSVKICLVCSLTVEYVFSAGAGTNGPPPSRFLWLNAVEQPCHRALYKARRGSPPLG